MPKLVKVEALAAQESFETKRWYRQRSLLAADRFDQDLRNALLMIAENPERFPKFVLGTRRCLLKRYPYRVVFKEFEDRIVIVAIAHCKRRLSYWRRRLK